LLLVPDGSSDLQQPPPAEVTAAIDQLLPTTYTADEK